MTNGSKKITIDTTHSSAIESVTNECSFIA